ncbi:glycosyltransferase [Paenibacillus sp. CH40]|uniref:glycosyltransferase n=1 Tax=Paenibacillus sp. CH40 TaxID=2962045 RepID=UPI0020B8ACC4|nr:glycosyltransferase [Paenibacillus sp. CH40]MCP3794772.1 glycosyltransferase [Paenibacillus sp. CH40]
MDYNYTQQPGIKINKKKVDHVETPLVSVITPFYNSAKYIEQTANSLFNQTFPYFEWIIVNDGSNNKIDVEMLVELADSDSRIILHHQENGGPSVARNKGVELSSTEIIIPLDADDLLDPTYIECVYWSLYCNPQASWTYSDSLGFENQEYLWKKSFSAEQMKTENLLTCTAGIRKKDFFEVGGYDVSESLHYEDWALWLKLLSKGKYPVHMSWYGFWYRKTDTGGLSNTSKNVARHENAMSIIKKTGKNVDTNVQAIEFPRFRGVNFEKPRKWDWTRNNLKLNDKTKMLMILPHMVMGGADLFNLDVVSRLNKDQFEVSVITTNPGDSSWRQRFEKHTNDIFDLTTFLDVKDWSAFIHYFIKTRKINVVMVSNSYYGYYLIPWLKKEFPDLKIIDYVHMEEMGWRAGGYARTSAVVSDIIDKTYVCNDHLRELMIKTFNRKQSDVETLYIGVDIDEYDPTKFPKSKIKTQLGINNDRPVVLFPCRIAEQKRPFLMLAIAKKIIEKIPDIVFLVVGDGPQFEELKQKIKKDKLEDNIYLVGRQSNMKPFYKVSDLTLICSIREGLALTAYESMAMGVPVISSDVGGQKELVDDRVGKLLPFLQKKTEFIDIEIGKEYSQKEIDQYVTAIMDLLKDSETYQRKSENCRAKIIESFDKNLLIQKLEEELLKLISDKGTLESDLVKAMQKMPNLIDDYITLYCEFLQREADLEWIWNERINFNSKLNKSTGIQENEKSDLIEGLASLELQKIYSMRTWKIISKYQRFMDESRAGILLSKIRNILFNK